MTANFNFTVTTEDLIIKFSCANHKKRIDAMVKNLQITGGENEHKKMCRFSSPDSSVRFSFDGEEVEGNNISHEAVFFENTDYPLIVRGRGGKKLQRIELYIADHKRSDTDKKDTIQSDDGELFGSLNFRNQVGETDFKIEYTTTDGKQHTVQFATEVLSYKLDYRSDLKTIIADVEQEYAMLSYSLLKDTYLNFRTKSGRSTELIWWQIFKSCYDDIMTATRIIIDRPKRRLHTVAKHERAERLQFLPRTLETEYEVHKNNPAYLYRTEELVLSHDTIENRFLKYAIREMHQKFTTIAKHIMTAMRLTDNSRLSGDIDKMDDELRRMVNHPFFRGIGAFKGFSQDSLVMKQQHGYKEIFQNWLVLQQGYDLEEGMRKLEVKDISDLYEIWCFIKVKNIVQDVLHELRLDATAKVNGRDVTRDFIPQLLYGGSVSFLQADGVELASVSYNAQVEKETTKAESAIIGTDTLTTVQRPDIVLRLTKENDNMLFTYLFDAKYRINDTQIGGHDVPPPDAIDQMHRYRDAIYYKEDDNDNLKKEIVAGYVLFPGNIPGEAMEDGSYYYQKSNKRIGIGAFPLKPDQQLRNENGELVINPNSSEQALRKQIREWLEDNDAKTTLLHNAIPQKGLEYTNEPVVEGAYLLTMVDNDVNDDHAAIVDGQAKKFVSGFALLEVGVNCQRTKYLAIVENHIVKGYYRIEKAKIVDMTERLEIIGSRHKDKPFRVEFALGAYKVIKPFTYGIDMLARRGVVLTRQKFLEYQRKT